VDNPDNNPDLNTNICPVKPSITITLQQSPRAQKGEQKETVT